MNAFHKHHRQLRRGKDERPVNILKVGTELHDWIHHHPAEAEELGWIVSQYADPADVSVVIPDVILKEAPKKKKRAKAASTPAERKARVNYTIRTPKDEENALPEMELALRRFLAPQLRQLMDDPEEASAYWVWMTAALVVLQSPVVSQRDE